MRKSSRVARGIRTTRADQRAVAGRARVRFGDARKDQRAGRAEERPARGGLYDAGSIERQRPPAFMDVGPNTRTWRKIKAVLRADGSWRTSLEAVDDNSETDFRCRRQIAGTRKMETGPNLIKDHPPRFLEAMATALTPYDCRENVIGRSSLLCSTRFPLMRRVIGPAFRPRGPLGRKPCGIRDAAGRD